MIYNDLNDDEDDDDDDGSTYAAAKAKIVELLEAAGALTAAQLPGDDDEDGNA